MNILLFIVAIPVFAAPQWLQQTSGVTARLRGVSAVSDRIAWASGADLEEIAASYHAKFNRPLPTTSLVRPDEYQLELSKTNPNATRIETPPHSTGLAFDILYRYMTLHDCSRAVARDVGPGPSKRCRRIEVLRENPRSLSRSPSLTAHGRMKNLSVPP
jgi:hypothetical protein